MSFIAEHPDTPEHTTSSPFRLGLLVSGALHASLLWLVFQLSGAPQAPISPPKTITVKLLAALPGQRSLPVVPSDGRLESVERQQAELPASARPAMTETTGENVHKLPEGPVIYKPAIKENRETSSLIAIAAIAAPNSQPVIPDSGKQHPPPSPALSPVSGQANKPEPVVASVAAAATGRASGESPSADANNSIGNSAKVGKPKAVSPDGADSMAQWQGQLLDKLERVRRYPKSARQQRQQGIAYLRFALNRQGRVLSSRIEKSSGIHVLDEEAMALIHRAEPLPSPPLEVTGERIELVIPVQFSLK